MQHRHDHDHPEVPARDLPLIAKPHEGKGPLTRPFLFYHRLIDSSPQPDSRYAVARLMVTLAIMTLGASGVHQFRGGGEWPALRAAARAGSP